MNEAMTFDPKFLFRGSLNSVMFKKEGGPHFGAVRGRIQTMFKNGESVTWGSHHVLHPSATVDNLEELASVVAVSLLAIITDYMARNNIFNQNGILRVACEQALNALKGSMSSPTGAAIQLLVDALEKSDCQCGKIPHNFGCEMKT